MQGDRGDEGRRHHERETGAAFSRRRRLREQQNRSNVFEVAPRYRAKADFEILGEPGCLHRQAPSPAAAGASDPASWNRSGPRRRRVANLHELSVLGEAAPIREPGYIRTGPPSWPLLNRISDRPNVSSAVATRPAIVRRSGPSRGTEPPAPRDRDPTHRFVPPANELVPGVRSPQPGSLDHDSL